MSKRISKKFKRELFFSAWALERWNNLRQRIIESQNKSFVVILGDCDEIISDLACLTQRLSSRLLPPNLDHIEELVRDDESLMEAIYVHAISILHKLHLVALPETDNIPERIFIIASYIEEALNKLEFEDVEFELEEEEEVSA